MSELSFKTLEKDRTQLNKIERPSTTYWQDSWERLRRHRMGRIGLIIVTVMILFAIIGPFLSQHTYSDQDLTRSFEGPSRYEIMGYDMLGRSMLIRMAYGARISLAVGFASTFISLTIGIIYGTFSGYKGGAIDHIMMRFIEILMSIPSMLYVILLMTIFEPGLTNVFVVIGITGWLTMARLVRGEMLSLKEREYILAARVSGVSSFRIMFQHLVPNAMGPIIVAMTFAIPGAIFLESFLSFMGLGVSAPMPSWGSLAAAGIASFRSHPHVLFFPSIFISLTILGFNLLGDGLRDSLDPKLRQ